MQETRTFRTLNSLTALVEEETGKHIFDFRFEEGLRRLEEYSILKKPVDDNYKKMAVEMKTDWYNRLYEKGKNPWNTFCGKTLEPSSKLMKDKINVCNFGKTAKYLAKVFDANYKMTPEREIDNVFANTIIVKLAVSFHHEDDMEFSDFNKLINKTRDILVDFGYYISEINNSVLTDIFGRRHYLARYYF